MKPGIVLLAALLAGCSGGARDAADLGNRDLTQRSCDKRGDCVTALSNVWGGDHIQLTIEASVTRLDYDCAAGTINLAPQAGTDRDFRVTGMHTFMRPGPVYQGDPEDKHAAEYSGTIRGDLLTVTVRVPDRNVQLGPFTLRHGKQGTLYRCL